VGVVSAVNSYSPGAALAERRALLTRAADWEAKRQVAAERRDWPLLAQAERELGRLWRRYAQLGDEA
jgi:hypothetical protein